MARVNMVHLRRRARAARPSAAGPQEALELATDGTVLLRLRRPWRDGTRAIRFAPTELLEKLAAMIPKPRIKLLVYHGAFAPHARGRGDAVRRAKESAAPAATSPGGNRAEAGGVGADAGAGAPGGVPSGASPPDQGAPRAPETRPSAPAPGAPRPPPVRGGYIRPTYYAWAELLRRTFAIDVLACPGCGGRLRLLATITDPGVIAKILHHLGLPVELLVAAPACQAAWWPPASADWPR